MGFLVVSRSLLPEGLRRILMRIRANYLPSSGISTDYKRIEASAFTSLAKDLENSWKDESIPEKQFALVRNQLENYARGESMPVFDALVHILQLNIPDVNGSTLLEIGCSSGYYSRVLAARNINVQYSGCDLSEAFIQFAQQLYPNLDFRVQDATKLDYADDAFRIVVSGCCILHIADYEAAIAEAARISSKYVVFHRTPVLHGSGPIFYEKKAYGVSTFEIHFHEQSLLKMFRKYGLRIIDINTHSVRYEPSLCEAVCMKTYLLSKG